VGDVRVTPRFRSPLEKELSAGVTAADAAGGATGVVAQEAAGG
jgi:hypothetical protein